MDDQQSKVLVIDDEPDVVDFMSRVFENFKHIKFLTAANARQGIEIAKAERPKVILVDLRMPGVSGEDALRELKPILPDTRFIVMTGWDDGMTKERIMNEIGIDAYFDKPVDLEKVVNKVIELVMVTKRTEKNGGA